MHVDAMIPSGRITVKDASDPADIRLEVTKDPGSPLLEAA